MIFRAFLPLILLAIGFIGSEVVAARGLNTGLHWENIHPLLMHFCVPVTLFYLGLKIPSEGLRQQWLPATAYAIVGSGCAMFFSSYVLNSSIGGSSGFPVSAAVLAACLLTLSDLSSVPSVPNGLQSDDSTRQRLEIESLVVGAIGGTIYSALVMPSIAFDPIFVWVEFARSSLVSISIAAIAVFLVWLLDKLSGEDGQGLLTLILAIAALLGGTWLSIRFDASVTLFAIVFALAARNLVSHSAWQPINFVAVLSALLIVGASFTLELFMDRWIAMLIGAGLVLLTRIFTILPIFWLLYEFGTPVHRNEPWLATFAAPKASIALALAISIPLEFSGWYTVQAIVYGGVMASLVATAITSTLLHFKVNL